jgi:hypothetical protein
MKKYFTGLFILINVILVLVLTTIQCNRDEFSLNFIENRNLAKGRQLLPNLVPVGIDDKIVDLYGDTLYTGFWIADHDTFTADFPCIVANYGTAPFIADPTKNYDILHVKSALLDTVTGELSRCMEYWKSEFRPWGACIAGLECGVSGSNTIGINNYDWYDIVLENLRFGYNVTMIEYDVNRLYAETNNQDNDLFVGWYWEDTSILYGCGEAAQGCFNGWLNNKYITPKLKNQLRNMTPEIVSELKIKARQHRIIPHQVR